MSILCHCCKQPIESFEDIQITHKGKCSQLPLETNSPKERILEDGRMNTQAAAQYLGCSVSKLTQTRCAGKIGPKFVKMFSSVWYYKKDLDEWLQKKEQNKFTATSQARYFEIRNKQ